MKLSKKQMVMGSAAVPILITAVLVIRCFYSFCQSDESFYAALAHRLWTGERMITDEWNTTQFYVPLLLPFYGLFMTVRGSTDGVLLFLRLLYVVFAAITASKLFSLTWRETESGWCAAVTASVILLFCRANIQGVSYYNLCMLCCVSGFCSGAEALRRHGKIRLLQLIWTGILFASAVLCDPFLTPFVLLAVLAGFVLTKHRRETAWIVAGIAMLAALYCGYLFIGRNAAEVLRNLRFVLDDPESSSVMHNLRSTVIQTARLSKYVAIPALLLTAGSVLCRKKESVYKLLLPYFLLQTLMMGITAVMTLKELCDAIVIPMTVVSFPFLFFKNESFRLPSILYLIGVVNAAAYAMASNTGVDAAAVGFCISAAAGIWLCCIAATDLPMKNWQRSLILTALAISLTAPMFCQRVIGVYRDAPLTELNTQLQQGPAKGLYTTAAHAEQYETVCRELLNFSADHPDGRILYCKTLPWAYLLTPYGYGTSSPWRTHTETLETYYSVHPENRADYICVLDPDIGGWERSPLNRNPGVSTPNAFDYSGAFWSKLQEAPILKQTDYFTIYDMRNLWNK